MRKAHIVPVVCVLFAVAGGVGCKHDQSRVAETSAMPQSAASPPTGSVQQLATESPNQAAGVTWTIPPGWEVQGPRSMRVATYRVHAIAGDPEDAECAVYFFGAGQGGSVEANMDRWAHQFTAPDGSPAPSPKLNKLTVGGLQVSTIAVSGTYLGAAMMAQQEVKKPRFRMVAAVVEAPQGLLFFKLIGPFNTVAAAEHDFNSLLGSLHRQ